ncbi:phosphatase PAP2 family protein [Plantactinospora sp. GCM10030261]|uniref:phosphatase PAP2 family protein n=1 Tax=Plantactinospora sp. GCM10030261 TaxID=3273420 RepID=UPI0036091A60
MRDGPVVREKLRSRSVCPAGWWPDAVLLVALLALTVALANGHLFGWDRAVADWADTHRPPAAYWTARILNYLGQGTPLLLIALGLAGLVAWRTRSVRPVLPVLLTAALIYLTVAPLKILTARPAPSADVREPFLPPAQTLPLFQHDLPLSYARSYPSGHVTNTILWYGVLALLLAALLRTLGRSLPDGLVTLVRVLPPAVVFGTTTYLGWHWLTDSVAGLLLGLILDRLLHRVPWDDVPLPGRLGEWTRPALFREDRPELFGEGRTE